jgi:hypothetical protein
MMVGQAQQNPDPFAAILAGLGQSAESEKATVSQGYQPMIEALMQALGGVDARPGPSLAEVPQGPNPLGSMAAIFASTLAEQLGARGAVGNIQGQMAQQAESRSGAQQRNQERTTADVRQRQMDRLSTLLKIGEAKADAAKQSNDWNAYEAQLKFNAQKEMQLEKMRQTGRQALQDEKAASALQNIEARGKEQRKTATLRSSLSVRFGQDPRFKLMIQEADDRVALLKRTSEAMRKANQSAMAAFIDPLPYTQEEIVAQEQSEEDQAIEMYQEIQKRMEGAPKAETPAAKKPLGDFKKEK